MLIKAPQALGKHPGVPAQGCMRPLRELLHVSERAVAGVQHLLLQATLISTAHTALQRTAPAPSHSPTSLHRPPLPAEDRMTGIAASERFLKVRIPLVWNGVLAPLPIVSKALEALLLLLLAWISTICTRQGVDLQEQLECRLVCVCLMV